MEHYLHKLLARFLRDPYPIPDISDFTETPVVVDQCRINYATIGSGQALVFVHGWSSNWHGWIPLARQLQENFTLYLLDLPGYGASDNLEEYSLSRQAQFVTRFIRQERIHPVALIGASMGVNIVAVCMGNDPTIARSCVLLGPVFRHNRNAIAADIVTTLLRLARDKKMLEPIPQRILSRRLFSYLVAKYINMHRFNAALIDRYNLEGKRKMRANAYVDLGVDAHGFKLQEELADIRTPTLLVSGAHDRITNPRQTQHALAGINGNFQFATIADSGHLISLEQPEVLADVIERFVRQLR